MQKASSSFPGTPAGKQGRSESGRHTNALTVRTQGHPRAVSSGWNLHATLDKARGIPGASPSVHPLKKIGRAAPVGAWLPRKKTL